MGRLHESAIAKCRGGPALTRLSVVGYVVALFCMLMHPAVFYARLDTNSHSASGWCWHEQEDSTGPGIAG